MAKSLHAVDYLAEPGKHPVKPVCVLFGDEEFLKRHALTAIRQAVLGGGDADLSYRVFEGGTALLRDVLDELATLAMFGGGRRLVLVEAADEFVTCHRRELEDYVSQPRTSGVLVLGVKTFAANTRLFKAVAAEGLAIDCGSPPPGRLGRWLSAWAKQTHNVGLTQALADTLVEQVGAELGLLDQELAKLALVVGPGGKITAEVLRQSVGSWRAKTTWVMLDAVLDGDVRDAMLQLDRLLLAGENPIAILGQISASLRRLAAATRIVLNGEAAGRRVSLRDALAQAGVKGFVLAKAEGQLRKLGRVRGGRLYEWLLETDLALKGDSALPPRLILERLIVRISAPESRQPAGSR
jgi:DNA polymerase-3 subunit delta